MQNSVVVFILSVSDGKHPFWVNLVQKIKTVSLRNFVPRLIPNMQNSKALLTFSILDQKHPFWINLVQKIKIVSLS